MKYYRLFTILLVASMFACTGEKGTSNLEEETVSTVLPDETNEVTVMTLKNRVFNHELISNGKLSARNFVDLKFESAEPIAKIYVKNGDRVKKGQKLAELVTFRLNNKTAQAKDALERTKLELQDVLIGQGYKIEDSTKVPEATMQLVRVKSGYDQALYAYQLAEYEQKNAVLTAPFDGVVANLFAKVYNT
ncbi:MAG: biotin/lipoyl-binding protein, partial [Parabacteroides sp.]|nr:biotin/lipoyl-binding protein [Parabacteroides sp.]